MTVDEYEALLAAKHETMAPDEFKSFLIEEVMERMRINVSTQAENAALKKRVEQLEEGKGSVGSD